MKTQILFCLLFFYSIGATSQKKTYYISSHGNDLNNGLGITSAWKTLSPVNNLNLEPGDQVLLEGGQNFTGTIELNADDLGTATSPIVISSYGNGMATINVVNTAGIQGINSGGLTISRLILKGNGSDHNGIGFFINQTQSDINHIFIDSIEVSGFGGRGFLVGAYNTDRGFNHVTVEHSSFHDNGIAGFESFGAWPAFSHKNFNIRFCKFYNNAGVLTSTKTTGTGLVISGVNGGVIEYCEAYNNGANNRSLGGGPVGIWVYDAKNVVIQYCESHHNKAGLFKDGGGFDIDGGSQYCVVQYCYSHDNEGYGMALVEYGSPNEFTGNIIRYNISQNDGRKNNYGAIALYAYDASHKVKNSEVYNNTVYVNANDLVNGQPSAIGIESGNFSGVSIRNNIFYVTQGVKMIHSLYSPGSSDIHFQNNNYYSTADIYDFSWNGILYTSFNSWKAIATDQETTAIIQNPLLENPGSGSTVRPADGGSFLSLFGYSLNSFSPLVNKATRIGDIGNRDFFGNPLPATGNYDIGSAEAIIPYVLPFRLLSFTGYAINNQVQLKWSISGEENIEQYEIQRSMNGIDYKTIGQVQTSGKSSYQFLDPYTDATAVYYRLASSFPDGRSHLSNFIKISKTVQKQPQVFYKEGHGIQVQLYCETGGRVSLAIYSSGGALLYSIVKEVGLGYNSFVIEDAVRWKPGVYFLTIQTGNTIVMKIVK